MDQHINFDQECGRHLEKVKLFCVDHRELCCAVCVSTNHHQCNDVRSIEDIVHDQSQRFASDYPSIIRDIEKLKTEMEKIISEKKIIAKQFLQERDQIINSMDNRIDRIIERLNKLRHVFKRETDQLYKPTESSMLAKEKAAESFMKNIQSCSEILVTAERNGTPQQKFITFENARHQISSHYHQIKYELLENVVVHFTTEPSTILNILEETLNSVGTVSISTDSSRATHDVLLNTNRILKNLNSRTKVSTEMCAAQVETDLMTSPVTFIKALTIEEFERGTWFSGITYTADGRLVMADRMNNRLVELDDEYNMVKEYKIDRRPSDVAAGNKDNEIYIAVDGDYIYKCTLNTDLIIVRRIKAPSETWGIAVSGDNIIVGTPDTVEILTQDGSTVRSIPKSGYGSCVAVSHTQHKIYHKDNHDVVCRTWEGQEVFRYQHQQLKWPCGIDIDSDGNIYICGYDSHNLHRVSHGRQKVIKLHNILQPCNLVIHPQKKELVVTSHSEDTVCEVYRFG